MKGAFISILTLTVWLFILTHDYMEMRKEIGNLWDILRDLSEGLREDAEKLRVAAERLAQLEDDNK